ncbi:MAG: hypothetical protein V4585_09770 [Bacteroidota bacterium]
MISVSSKAQRETETWKFNTNTCNHPLSISFDMQFLNNQNLINNPYLKIKSDVPITLIVPNLPISQTLGANRTMSIPANSEILVSLPLNGYFISFPTQPNWYELNEHIIKKYYNAGIVGGGRNILIVTSNEKDKEEIRQIICDYWR